MKFFVMIFLVFNIVACSTVSGVGKDIQGAADWTHDKMNGK